MPFKRHQGDDTIKEYEHAPYLLLLLLVKTVDNPKGGKKYNVCLPAEVKRDVETLNQLVWSQEHDEERMIETCDNILSGVWGSLSTWNPSEKNLVPDPTIQVVALHQLRRDGRWNHPSHGTKLLAKFQYMIVRVALSGYSYSPLT